MSEGHVANNGPFTGEDVGEELQFHRGVCTEIENQVGIGFLESGIGVSGFQDVFETELRGQGVQLVIETSAFHENGIVRVLLENPGEVCFGQEYGLEEEDCGEASVVRELRGDLFSEGGGRQNRLQVVKYDESVTAFFQEVYDVVLGGNAAVQLDVVFGEEFPQLVVVGVLVDGVA